MAILAGDGMTTMAFDLIASDAEPSKAAALVRELATAAYRAGAKFVDVWYFDLHVKRARLLHAREEDLQALPVTIRDILKLRGDVERAETGTLPNDGKVIEDTRRYS